MATKYREMIAAQTLTGTAASYYTAPALTQGAIHAATANNPGTSPVVVNLYKGSAGNAATKIASATVPAGQTKTLYDAINHKLEPGQQLWADGLACGLNVSGVEYVPESS